MKGTFVSICHLNKPLELNLKLPLKCNFKNILNCNVTTRNVNNLISNLGKTFNTYKSLATNQYEMYDSVSTDTEQQLNESA